MWHAIATALSSLWPERSSLAAPSSRPRGHLDRHRRTALDTSAREPAADALRESEARFRAAFHGAGVAMALVDAGGCLLETNRTFREMLGYAGEELDRIELAALLHPHDRALARQDFRERPERSVGPVLGERRYRRKDGSYLHGLLRSSAARDASGRLLCSVALVEDVSQRKAAEAQLLLAGRVPSMGTLAAGVAHEINNPLAFVDANVAFALDELRRTGVASPAVIEALDESRHGTLRVRDIVRDLKKLSRADGPDDASLDVREVLRSSVSLARNELKQRARVTVSLGDVPLVTGSARRLGQVFLNLILNAAQSLEPGAADRNEIRISCRAIDGDRVAVDVEDTGCGIAPEILPRIFEPFFTTKPVGVGTGLGLSICHGIVKALGGEIQVESRLGAGSRFRVLLRVGAHARSERPARPERRAADAAAPRGRVLVVDDEPMVGRAVARILRHQHDVEVVSSARDALARLRADPSYDVILCDVMMPELTGIDVYRRRSAMAPPFDHRMVFLTGGAFTPRAHALAGTIRDEQVDEPFVATTLQETVDHLVSGRRARGAPVAGAAAYDPPEERRGGGPGEHRPRRTPSYPS